MTVLETFQFSQKYAKGSKHFPQCKSQSEVDILPLSLSTTHIYPSNTMAQVELPSPDTLDISHAAGNASPEIKRLPGCPSLFFENHMSMNVDSLVFGEAGIKGGK